MLLTTLRHGEDAARVAERFIAAVSKPCQIGEYEIALGASVGIAVHPTDGEDLETLLKHADVAMYHAKAEGRGGYRFYSQFMQTEAAQQLALEADLLQGLASQQFVLHYQPQIEMATGRIASVEALIRWQHPTRGLVEPNDFIPLAEKCGLIHAISDWVLHTTCTQAAAWHLAGLGRISVAVNISGSSFERNDLIGILSHALDQSGLDPHCLELEVTESTMMSDLEVVVGTLRNLKGIGVSLSIDDFGTGFSSLSYLQRLPLDKIKIDRAFIRNLDTTEGSVLVQTIIAMARSLGLQIIAEGVETVAQADFLTAEECPVMQGFLFSRPLDVQAIGALLRQEAEAAQPNAVI